MKLRHILIPILICLVAAAEAKPRKKAKSVYVPKYASIVIDAHSGHVLSAEKPDTITYPASLTKMMTLYLLFEALEQGKVKINQKLWVSKHATRQKPSKLYLKNGESIHVEDAILALMTKSANDVAVVIAEALGGTEQNFARKMTAKARSLGMKNTTFQNASGMPNNYQKTTARDMALLSQMLLKHYPRYYRYFQTRIFSFRGQKYKNHNALLGKVPGVDGIKTGYIAASGWNLSASAVRSGHRIIAVVLGGKSRNWRDKRVTNLIEAGFKKLRFNKINFVPRPQVKPRFSLTAAHPQVKPTLDPVITPDAKPVPAVVEGEWAVQVGAFRSARRANEIAIAVQQAVPDLSTAKISISAVKHTRGKLYRARLIDLPKTTAQRSCPQIVKAGHSCLAIKTKK